MKTTKIDAKRIKEMEADGSKVIRHAGEIPHWSLQRPGGLSGGASTSASIRDLHRWWKNQK